MSRGPILLCTLVAMLAAASEAAAQAPAVPPVAAAAPGGASAGPESASELLGRAFENLYAEDYIQTLVLATRVRGGSEMRRRLQLTRRQSTRPSKTLLRFLYPQAIRRTSVLVLENEGASDDLYVYLPAVRITRHLSSAQRADSFFGTDLSYEDVEPKYVEDFEVRFLEQDASAEPPTGEPACVRIEITPVPSFDSAYERQVSCLEEERAIILWTDYYVRGRHLKRLTIDPAEVRQVGRRWVPFLITVETPRQRSLTRVITESYELQAEIPDVLFNGWNLEAGDARSDRRRTTPALDDEADATPDAAGD